ncbi:phosphotransferase family protein [Agromyces aerolatus]|uniref:phosphotransferase family protein n=1 Tax=Agromyces sp. LY-1074 TaxID=3074080 RepID=UPI00285AAFB5|nr:MULTISPECIES: phosphotransferase [unclassified Agromyces]MDR5700163.1 phosphotransferase [Agromyces sp. LY-1074]MDR5706469.1 phosphotransferase [Agromyces sp. LY-1358]
MVLQDDERSMLLELGRRHRLWDAGSEPELLARGTENTTFAVAECVVRRSADSQALAREVALLSALADATSVPVPVPLMYDPELGLFAYRRLPGTPLIVRPSADPCGVERALIDVLGALRSLDPELLPTDAYSNDAWHRDATRAFALVAPHLAGRRARRVREFLDERPPSDRPEAIAQHNDLGAEHILVDDVGRVTGVIDWTDAARADPARDLGSIHRDLGPASAFRVAESLGHPLTDDEVRRIRFHARCRWIEDAAFALEAPAPRHRYLANVRRTFDHTFGHSR